MSSLSGSEEKLGEDVDGVQRRAIEKSIGCLDVERLYGVTVVEAQGACRRESRCAKSLRDKSGEGDEEEKPRKSGKRSAIVDEEDVVFQRCLLERSRGE